MHDYASEQLLNSITNDQNTFMVHRNLIQEFGLNSAIFITNLMENYKDYYNLAGFVDYNFYVTMKEQSTQTGLSIYRLRKCKKALTENGTIETRLEGIPAKEIYTINFDKLIDIMKGER